MIDQSKVGKFIRSIRKEKDITKRQLADNIGVSERAISRWESGQMMPDTGKMPDLCRVLDITVNELIAGERITEEDFVSRSDDNMIALIKDTEKMKEDSNGSALGLIMGLVLLTLFMGVIISMSIGVINLYWFIDLPSLIVVFGIQFVILGASGQFVNFFRSFKIIFASRKYTKEELATYVQRSEYALDLGRKATIIGAVAASLVSFVALMGSYSDPSTIGPNLAVMILTLFYASIVALVLLIIKGRVHKKA